MDNKIKIIHYALIAFCIIQLISVFSLYNAMQTIGKTDIEQESTPLQEKATDNLVLAPPVREHQLTEKRRNTSVEVVADAAVKRLMLQKQCPKTDFLVSGVSLEPNIADGSVRSFYMRETCPIYEIITRNDLVLIDASQSDKPLAKFVRAVPGDTISLIGWSEGFSTLQVNGEDIKTSDGEFYRIPADRVPIMKLYIDAYKDGVPEGAYLLLGDNDDNSLDSTTLGLVSYKDIVGLAAVETVE